ncbi:MAG: carboxylating nicotinate-nucleotide diphosphorylase [Candidatus Thorarchaeota archaeon]|nr:carboxylating nicotinate-nucleotide diphosphorylase [Candidatus Thorarchaeota archaeon]
MTGLPPEAVEALRRYLDEDIRSGDITASVLGPLDAPAVATVFAKSRSILAGLEEAKAIAEITGLTHEALVFEGNWVNTGQAVLRARGPAKTLLAVERVILNIMMRMSGIATKTYLMLEKARRFNPSIRVAATRKTTPGFRFFEKRAVTVGGGDPHRYALDDMVLIKNNHLALVGGVARAVRIARERVSFSKKVSCEVRSLQEAMEAVDSGADVILLDNFTPNTARAVVDTLKQRGLRDRVVLEASGGINDGNVTEFAQSGVDVLSSGALTHSYESADFNMLISMP